MLAHHHSADAFTLTPGIGRIIGKIKPPKPTTPFDPCSERLGKYRYKNCPPPTHF
ncbi:hypothetical protein MTR_3g016215 [Medicago truncatula]|nr:hypothetical protein MTR_3g016215 [Medicago truncatula]